MISYIIIYNKIDCFQRQHISSPVQIQLVVVHVEPLGFLSRDQHPQAVFRKNRDIFFSAIQQGVNTDGHSKNKFEGNADIELVKLTMKIYRQ